METIKHVHVRAIACAVPERVVQNSDYTASFGAENVDKFIKMSGVVSRHVAEEPQTSSDFAFVAAQNVLTRLGWDPESVDALIFVTQCPDYKSIPSTSCVLHMRLGCKKACVAFDIVQGCSGFVYGLLVAGRLCSPNLKRVLLLGGDTSTRVISPEDKSAAMLFGDSGFAAALEFDAESEAGWQAEYRTDGTGFKNIIVPAGGYRQSACTAERRQWGEGIFRRDDEIYMNGTDVFSFTITEVPQLINAFMAALSKTPENVDALVLHQANLFILKQVAKMTKFKMDKVPLSIDRYGNTSMTSIPLTLCDAFARPEAPRQKRDLVLCGFGVGLSWGAVNIALDSSVFLPVQETSHVFADWELTRS